MLRQVFVYDVESGLLRGMLALARGRVRQRQPRSARAQHGRSDVHDKVNAVSRDQTEELSQRNERQNNAIHVGAGLRIGDNHAASLLNPSRMDWSWARKSLMILS